MDGSTLNHDKPQKLSYKDPNLLCLVIIHTVGPTDKNSNLLESCYLACMDRLKEKSLCTIVSLVHPPILPCSFTIHSCFSPSPQAFPSISTGAYGYPVERASLVACRAIHHWLSNHPEDARKVKRIVFCTYSIKDSKAYRKALEEVFSRLQRKSITPNGERKRKRYV